MASSLARRFGCPVELSLEVLGGKWKAVLLAQLKNGPKSYGELRRLVPRVSDKMLTQRLTDLADHGLVVRSRGTRAVYSLTPRGESLRAVLDALYAWGTSLAPVVGASLDAPPPRRGTQPSRPRDQPRSIRRSGRAS